MRRCQSEGVGHKIQGGLKGSGSPGGDFTDQEEEGGWWG